MKPRLAHAVGEARQVPLGDRLDVGREHGGARALVLAPLAGDLVRRDDRDLRPQLAHALEHRLLVARVGVGVEQADRDRLDALGLEVVDDRRAAPLRSSGCALAAVVREPARHLAPQVARHERRRLHVVEVEVVGPVAARDLERVAEALGRDQRRLDALALGDRVDHERRAVREEADRPSLGDAALRDHVEHAALEVGRRRVGLRGQDLLPAGLGVGREGDEVGERPADVRRHAEGAHAALSYQILRGGRGGPSSAADCPAGSPCLPRAARERSPCPRSRPRPLSARRFGSSRRRKSSGRSRRSSCWSTRSWRAPPGPPFPSRERPPAARPRRPRRGPSSFREQCARRRPAATARGACSSTPPTGGCAGTASRSSGGCGGRGSPGGSCWSAGRSSRQPASRARGHRRRS